MTAMNQALVRHLKSQAFSFEAHEISGKKVKQSRIETKVMKWHSLPANLVYFHSEPSEGVEFNAPNEVILKASQLGFSWRTVHTVSATFLIEVGDESQDSFALKSAARNWVQKESETVFDEIRSSVSEFIASTGFETNDERPSVKVNSQGSYQSFKIIAAGKKRCIQIIARANLQEPIEFLSISELKQAVKAHCKPLGIGEYTHLKTTKDYFEAITQIYDEAIESVNA